MNLFGIIVGLGLGIGLAAVLEFRDTSLRTEDEIVRLFALPVIALVPVLYTTADQRRTRRRIVMAFAAATFVIGVAAVAMAWKLGFLRPLV
jgi:hypothetical protein